MFAGTFDCRPDLLLPAGMRRVADVVALHDKRVAHHANRWALHIHTWYGRPVGVIWWEAHVRWSKIHDIFCVGDKESIAAECERKVHIRLFRDHVTLQNP